MFAGNGILFNGHLARHDDVAAAAVELDDLDGDIGADEAVEILHRAHVDLRGGHEGAGADVDHEAALDAREHAAGNQESFGVGALEGVPTAKARGFLVGQGDVAFKVRAVAVNHDVDGVAFAHNDGSVGQMELLDGHDAFGLVSEVDDHLFVGDAQHMAGEQFAFGGRRKMTVFLYQMLVVVGVGGRKDFEALILRLVGHRHISPSAAAVDYARGRTTKAPLTVGGVHDWMPCY